jgi:hemerythrin
MVLFTWSDDLSVRVNVIDDQHKKLVALINTLHDAMRAGEGKLVLDKTLNELAEYTVYHFQAEEKYMQQFHYPNYLQHKAQHDAFVKKVVDFKKDYDAGRLGLTLDLMKFLRDWVENHIKSTDKGYTALFLKNGLK